VANIIERATQQKLDLGVRASQVIDCPSSQRNVNGWVEPEEWGRPGRVTSSNRGMPNLDPWTPTELS
jgi:hypothetical protein